MIDWGKYTIEQIKNGTSEDGTRLASLFSKDYVNVVGSSPCMNCPGLQSRVSEFLKLKNSPMKKLDNSGFVLKPMYNGLSLGFGSNVTISKANLSDELAIRFIKEHKKGADIFEKLPKGFDIESIGSEVSIEGKELSALTVKELKVKAEKLDLKKTGIKEDLIERIESKLTEGAEVETEEIEEVPELAEVTEEVEEDTTEKE